MSLRIVLFVAVLAACGGKGENAHVSRAKELMSVGEWDSARSELKLALKDSSDDANARALLLYCLDRGDGLKGLGADLFDLTIALHNSQAPGWLMTPEDERRNVEKALVATRQSLYDRGVDTKDGQELLATIVGAAKFGFANDDDQARKDEDAAILGSQGDAEAVAFLVGRLKSRDPETAQRYLVRMGESAVAPLKTAVQDTSFIGHAAAVSALAELEAELAARDFESSNKDLEDPSGARAIDGLDRLGPSFIKYPHVSARTRSHAQYVTLESGADGLLVIQGYDAKNRTILVGVYAFRAGEMKRLHVVSNGTPYGLDGKSVLFGLEPIKDGVAFKRIESRERTREVEVTGVPVPHEGMKVKLRGYAPHGQVVHGDEGGMWTVRVDTPIEGLSELTVAPSAMIGLREETYTTSTIVALTAKLDKDTLDVSTPAIPKISSADDYRAAMMTVVSRAVEAMKTDDCDKAAAALRDAADANQPLSDQANAWKTAHAEEAKAIEGEIAGKLSDKLAPVMGTFMKCEKKPAFAEAMKQLGTR